jgi:hypothetical protein
VLEAALGTLVAYFRVAPLEVSLAAEELEAEEWLVARIPSWARMQAPNTAPLNEPLGVRCSAAARHRAPSRVRAGGHPLVLLGALPAAPPLVQCHIHHALLKVRGRAAQDSATAATTPATAPATAPETAPTTAPPLSPSSLTSLPAEASGASGAVAGAYGAASGSGSGSTSSSTVASHGHGRAVVGSSIEAPRSSAAMWASAGYFASTPTMAPILAPTTATTSHGHWRAVVGNTAAAAAVA